MPSQWQAANGASLPTDTAQRFKISAPPKTDIWRPSETDDVFTAPYIYQVIQPSSFTSIAVTVSGPWKTQFDQGGLIIAFPRHDGLTRWIKAGIEYFEGAPALGVVGTDRFSDWSLSEGAPEATFEAVKDGSSLWVYATVNGRKLPLREVKWAFIDFEDGQGKDAEMRVGVYAAKPTPDEGDASRKIEVSFGRLDLQTMD